MLKSFTLKNGIKVATYQLPQLKSVHLSLSSRGGAIMETPANNGAAHFMEHMLVQGIPSFPTVEEFSQHIEGLSGGYGATTFRLRISFNITVPAPRLEDAIRIGSEVFFEPLFVSEAIEKERRAVESEIKQKMDSHWFEINRFFRETRYSKGSLLILSEAGSLEIVGKLTREDLINFWRELFFPKNTFLLIAGNFNNLKLKKQLEQYFGKYSSTKTFSGFPKIEDDLSARKVAIREDFDLRSCYIDLTYPALNLKDPLKFRLRQSLLINILGGLRNSRLFKLLRYQRGLVYSVDAGSSMLPGLGYVYVSSEVSLEHLEEVLTLVCQEVAAFKKDGLTEEELQLAKNFLTNQWLMTFDHPSSISSWIESDLLWEDKVLLPEECAKMIQDVTREELIQLMQDYWNFDKLNLIVQGPIENSQANIKKFEKIAEILS